MCYVTQTACNYSVHYFSILSAFVPSREAPISFVMSFRLSGYPYVRMYMGAAKSLARSGRKQANVSVRMAWISFGVLPCRKKTKTWWQLASRCCWNRGRPWHASELVSFLVGLRTYQHLGISALHTRSLFVKFDMENFHENPPRKSRFDSGRTRILRTLHEDRSIFDCCRRN